MYSNGTCTATWPVQQRVLYSNGTCTATWPTATWSLQQHDLYSNGACTATGPVPGTATGSVQQWDLYSKGTCTATGHVQQLDSATKTCTVYSVPQLRRVKQVKNRRGWNWYLSWLAGSWLEPDLDRACLNAVIPDPDPSSEMMQTDPMLYLCFERIWRLRKAAVCFNERQDVQRKLSSGSRRI